jgi:hypothetical protein
MKTAYLIAGWTGGSRCLAMTKVALARSIFCRTKVRGSPLRGAPAYPKGASAGSVARIWCSAPLFLLVDPDAQHTVLDETMDMQAKIVVQRASLGGRRRQDLTGVE